MAVMFGVLIAIPLLASPTMTVLEQIKFRAGMKNTFTMDGMEFIIEKRTTLVRIQEPKPLLMGLRIGGQMRGMGWADVEIAKYEKAPGPALEQAVEDYDGYRIAMYREIDPDGNLTVDSIEAHEQIQEQGWVQVNPERDLPDE